MPYPLTVDYKNFFELLNLENEVERDKQLIHLIDNHLNKHFLDDERLWFNRLCNNGLMNVILHCEKTIPNFSLYDHRYDENHFSNVSFIWTIEGGNLELIKYFINDKDFYLFKKREKLNIEIGSFLQYHKERKSYFTIENYSLIMNFLAEKFPEAIEEIFDRASRENKNDQITEVLKEFLVRYKDNLTEHLTKNENDSLTIHCMLGVLNDSYEFAKFIRKEFQEYPLDESRVQIQLYWTSRDIKHFKWMVANPDFFKLENHHFDRLFKEIFQSYFGSKNKKDNYEYFDTVVKAGLHKVTKDEFIYFFEENITNLVKKYYKEFNLKEFTELYDSYNNTSINFLKTKMAEKDYKELQKELKVNQNKVNRIKI
jgi:hypothetical protein